MEESSRGQGEERNARGGGSMVTAAEVVRSR